MAPQREVEIKFYVTDPGALARRLRSAGFRRVTPPTHEMNTLYDQPGQPLRRRGQLLRLRKYGQRWVLTHKAKGRAGRHKTRVETETDVANGEKMAGILAALGFTPSFRYEKFRSEWTDGKGEVVVDQTPIGTFAEIEGPPRWIDQVARKLAVERAEYITSNYAQLFFEWKQQTGNEATEMTFAAVGKPSAISRQHSAGRLQRRRGQ